MPIVIFALPVIALTLVAVVIRLALTLTDSGRTRPTTPETQRASRSVGVALAVASILAVVSTVFLAITDELGRGILLTGPISMLVLQVGLATATLIISTSVRSRSEVRAASLSPRRIWTSTPRILTATMAVATIVALGLAVVACAVASIDEGSGEYRSFTSLTESGIRTFGPFAGSFYSLPLGAVLTASALVAGATLIGVRRWGALNQPEIDLSLRLGIATRTVAATAMTAGLILIVLGTSLATAAQQMSSSPDDTPLWSLARIAMPASALLGFVLAAWAFVMFCFPSLGRRARP